MTNRTAATRYARALLDVATKEQVDLSQVEHDLTEFVSLFTANPTLAKALLNPVVPSARKRAAVEAILAHTAWLPVVRKTLLLLAERDRFMLLDDIAETFRARLMDQRNIVRATVTTASPLATEQATAIQESLAKATGRTVVMTTGVDPTMIGGMVARVGDTVYDASVTSQLQRLKQRLVESV